MKLIDDDPDPSTSTVEPRILHVVKVYGPNLGGLFGSDCYTFTEEPDMEIDDGYLIIKAPAREDVPARFVTYAPGQWSKTVYFKKESRS